MAKKAAAKVPSVVTTPQHISYRNVPPHLGGGRVSLYDARKGLPGLVPDVTDDNLGRNHWVLVHYPSRHWFAVNSKARGLAVLQEIHSGELKTALGDLLPKPAEKPPVRGQARASKEPAKAPSTGAEKGEESPPPAGDGEDDETPKSPPFHPTPVPIDAKFDAAMQLVFPPARLTAELERLLQATTPIYSKDGSYCGDEPAYSVQLQALKLSIEYHQGRPTEKEKPPEEKPRMSYDELKKWIMGNAAAQEYMQRLLDEAKRLAVAGKTSTPAPVPGKSET